MSVLNQFRMKLDRHLGRCPKCMRQSFLAAAAAWGLAATLWLVNAMGIVMLAAMAAALGATLLWLAHLAAYAVRAARATADAPLESRRRFASNLLKAAGAMAIITALPGTALADNCCDCSKCSSQQVCCKTANGCCGCFPGGIQC